MWLADDYNHSFFVSQIINKSFPLVSYFPNNSELSYHYGFDAITAVIMQATGIDYPYISSLLVFLIVISILSLLIQWFYKKNINEVWMILGGIFFLYADSVTSFFHPLNNKIPFMSVSSLLVQPAWLFTVYFIILFINYLDENSNFIDKKSDVKTLIPYLYILSLSAPLYSATSMVLIGCFLLFLSIMYLIKKQYKSLLIYCFTGIAILLSWNLLNWGISITGPAYDPPKYDLSVNVFNDTWTYIKYTFFYLAITLHFWILIFILYITKKTKDKIDIDIKFLFFLLPLYFLPVFIMAENAAYWDNYCKINAISLIATSILLVVYIRKVWEKNKPVSILIILLCCGFILNIKTFQRPFCAHKNYINHLDTKTELITFCKQNLSIKDKIFVISSELKPPYIVDRRTNRAINSYELWHTTNGFECISMRCGIPLINYVNFNFMVKREDEYLFLDNLNAFLMGNYNIVTELPLTHLICDKNDIPNYINILCNTDKIEVIKESNNEGWIIYKIKK